jgi:histidinol-phosphate aminotransferase
VTGPRVEDFTVDVPRALELVKTEQPDVILLTSPNNPTGTALPLDTVRAVVEAAPGVVVVDEAYAEFRRAGTPTALELLDEYPRLMVSRTMSKAFALAGGRLGYVAADAAMIDALRIVRLPYHLSAVTQAAALAALGHREELLARVDELRTTRDELADWLRAQGHEVAESDANFVLFGRFADRHAIWQGLVDRGVLIRETGPEGWLRVSVGTPDEMQAFYTSLQEVTR